MQEVNKKVLKAVVETPDYYTVGPFMTTSGRLIPIYPDCRKIFSNPRALRIIAKEVAKLLKKTELNLT